MALSESKREQFVEQGYLLVSGLIPEEIARAAEAAMWRACGADPADPSTWKALAGHNVLDEPALTACYTPEFLAAAAELAGDDPAGFRPPSRAYAINVLPTDVEWTWPRPHIDHAIKEHGHRTFPRAFRMATMTFLSDVPAHGGGTVVWPGSQRTLEALAKSDPQKFETMWALNQELRSVDLGAPVELTPRRGDVLFYPALCAHAGSLNVSDRPRLAMNAKW